MTAAFDGDAEGARRHFDINDLLEIVVVLEVHESSQVDDCLDTFVRTRRRRRMYLLQGFTLDHPIFV
jgi:hypothetical protein